MPETTRNQEPAGAGPPGAPPQSPSFGRRAPPPPERPEGKLQHDGRFGELFVIFLQNLLLSVITLGIYRFWGKTRIRRYIWSHTSFRGDRLEYSGTGLELFFGFLIALGLLGLPFAAWYLWLVLEPPSAEDPLKLLQQIGVLYILGFLLFYLGGVAVFAAQRFRSTRTNWRGIRGGLEGSAWVYGFLALGLTILNGLSLGWTKPWADATLLDYRLKRTYIGNQQARASVSLNGLYGPFAFAWLATGAAVAIAVTANVLFALSLERGAKGAEIDPTIAQLVLSYAIFGFVALVYYMSIQWYLARLLRNAAAGTEIDEAGFVFEPTFENLLALNLPNALMMIFTLGFAYPYVLLRKARFIARHMEIMGEINEDRLGQHQGNRPRVGEGLIEFLGVGGI